MTIFYQTNSSLLKKYILGDLNPTLPPVSGVLSIIHHRMYQRWGVFNSRPFGDFCKPAPRSKLARLAD
jgi:hypothetical protein